jgi:hypothetical protein
MSASATTTYPALATGPCAKVRIELREAEEQLRDYRSCLMALGALLSPAMSDEDLRRAKQLLDPVYHDALRDVRRRRAAALDAGALGLLAAAQRYAREAADEDCPEYGARLAHAAAALQQAAVDAARNTGET